jgi:hypothetical protein
MGSIEGTEEPAIESNDEDVGRRSLMGLLGAAAGAALLHGCSDAGEPETTPASGQGRNPLFTIDGGIQRTSYASLKAAVDANQAGTPITVIIDKPMEVGAASLTVPAHMTLRFQDGGQLLVSPGNSVTLSGPIVAPACPSRALFKLGGFGGPVDCTLADGGAGNCGLVVPNHSGTKYYANWWSDDSGNGGEADDPDGAADVGQQWNNMTRGVVKSGPAVRARHFAVAGFRKLKTMMDVRDFADAQHLDFSAAVIDIEMPGGGIAANFTNSTRLYVKRLRLKSDNPGPHVGVLLARSQAGSGLDSMIFDDLRISGQFKVACLYNVASRGNVFVGGHLQGQSDPASPTSYVAFFGGFVADSSVLANYPPYGSRPIESAAFQLGSARDQVLLATKFNTADLSKGTVYLRGFSEFVALSIYTQGGPKTNGNGPNAPYVVINAEDNSTANIAIHDIYTEGHSNPALLIENGGNNARRVGNVTFTARHFNTPGVRINPKFVGGVTIRVPGGDIVCDPATWLRDADLQNRSGKVDLGAVFTGRIVVNDTSKVTVPVNANVEAEITTLVRSDAASRNQLRTALAIAARPSVPTPEADEAIIWMDSVSGQLRATVSRCIDGKLHTTVLPFATT